MAPKTQSTNKTSLRTVINQVTKEKLAWLDSQKSLLNSCFQPILEKYEKPENKASLPFLQEIHKKLKNCPNSLNPIKDKTKDLTVFLNWIKVENADEVIYFGSQHLVRQWIETLIKKIRFQIERCEYSCLYANVMTQYMDLNDADSDGDTTGMEIQENPKDKETTIREFSARIFQAPTNFKKEEFEKFLNTELFNMDDPVQKNCLLRTRERMVNFSKKFHTDYSVSVEHLKLCIESLLAEDLLGSEKAVTLKELKENANALNEVCTLLTNRLRNFMQWKWPEPVHVDFRRNMAGRYRAYMDEDIVTALFLHYVGAQWSIQLKTLFKEIYSSKMWKRGAGTEGDLYFKSKFESIEGYRREFHGKSFLSILPSQMRDLAGTGYDDENRNKSTASEMAPIKIKQKLLRLISNEIQLNNILRPETPLTVVQTDMEWFGPSIVHEAVYILMNFFGVSKQWTTFFKQFLECPLRLESCDSTVHVRTRGVPISHMLSSLFGESLLFIMDLYVNQVSGLSLYRIHDDFWFWGHNQEMVNQAWTGINTFVNVAGLKLNEEKSASVSCTYLGNFASTIHGPEPLPQRQVKWGFTILSSDGIFRIDQELLDPHVKEMRQYLQKSETIMGWVHCHNRYIRFFIRNFVEPATTFGQQHIVQMMKALQSILKEVHKEAGGDPVEALKLKFSHIWKGKDVMDSWVHWPVEKGGLSLYNPFLDLIPLHEAYRKVEKKEKDAGHTNKFGGVMDEDKTEWKRIVEESRKRQKKRINQKDEEPQKTICEVQDETVTDLEASDSEDSVEDHDRFSKKKDTSRKKIKTKRIGYSAWWNRYRETRWKRWRERYCNLLNKVDPVVPAEGSTSDWKKCLYSSQIEDKLGDGSGFIDTDLIPLSLISSMQVSRVHKN